MKFEVFLDPQGSITLHDVDDFTFDPEDETAVFYHDDTTLSVIPRERILLVKELHVAPEPEKIN